MSIREFVEQLDETVKRSRLCESSELLSEAQDYIYENRDVLLKKFPDEWIAAFRTTIIEHDTNLRELVLKLRVGEIPLEYIALEKLNTEEMPLALQKDR